MRLIASDYDGTFNKGGISAAQQQAVRDWQAAGNLLGIVSGRSIDFLPPTLERDHIFCDFFIANNGAVITDGKGAILWERHASGELAIPLLQALFRLGCPYGSITTDFPCTVYAKVHDAKPGRYTLDTVPTIPYFHQISTILPSFEEATRVTAAIREEFGEFLNPLQNGICIDIVPAGIDKAQGIRALIALKGLSEADVIAVGDNVNDAAMIRAFSSYAVDNAVDSIKQLAGRVIPTVTDLIRAELCNVPTVPTKEG